MSNDMQRRIEAEQEKGRQLELEYKRAGQTCNSALDQLHSELFEIWSQVPVATQETTPPERKGSLAPIKLGCDLTHNDIWSYVGEYGLGGAPRVVWSRVGSIYYNPFRDEWIENHTVLSRAQIIEDFKKAVIDWRINEYPGIVEKRERRARESQELEERHPDRTVANAVAVILGIMFLYFFMYLGLPAILDSMAH